MRKTNFFLDFVKGIACILIVFMHCEFPGSFGAVVQSISRFAVPFFFMVSGYFCYKADGNVDYIRKIRHIGFITLVASLFYLLVTPLYSPGLPDLPNLKKLILWGVFNQPFYIAGQLWFLYALLYDYILFALIEKLGMRKLIKYMLPVCIAAYIALAQGAFLIGRSVPNYLYRNFLIEGFAFMALGYWLHEYHDRIHIPDRMLAVCLVTATLLCPVERYLLGRDFGVNIVSFIQVTALFLLCIHHPEFGESRLLTKLGTVYSLYVYIIHPAVWHLIDLVYAKVQINENQFALYVRPLLCVVSTIILAVLFVFLKSKVQDQLKQRKKGYCQ